MNLACGGLISQYCAGLVAADMWAAAVGT